MKTEKVRKPFLLPSWSDDAVAGAFSGFMGRILSAPFDVVKIRYQLLNRDVPNPPSMMQSFKTIIKDEGFLALWKGNLAATFLWVSYALLQFGLYGVFKKMAEDYDRKINKPTEKSARKITLFKTSLLFLAGASAGSIATFATYPFDVMRTQFAVQGKVKVYNNFKSFITYTYHHHGIRGIISIKIFFRIYIKKTFSLIF